jgi:hypothetical protein
VIVLSLALLAFAVVDLLRWSPEPVSKKRAVLALIGATTVTSALAGLSDLSVLAVVIVGAITATFVWGWLLLSDAPSPGFPLAWIFGALLASFAASSVGNPIGGPLRSWYSDLPFAFVKQVGVDQFFLGMSALLFMLATANRVVRLVLEAAGTPATKGETKLTGGRLLGPMERLFVGTMVLSGDLTGAAVVIAAKGLLRLPEIRSSAEQAGGAADQVTEYFLIGTFSSLLIAGGLAALVSVSG